VASAHYDTSDGDCGVTELMIILLCVAMAVGLAVPRAPLWTWTSPLSEWARRAGARPYCWEHPSSGWGEAQSVYGDARRGVTIVCQRAVQQHHWSREPRRIRNRRQPGLWPWLG